jgi:hypothetical protein
MSNKRIKKKHGHYKCFCGRNRTYLHVKKDNFRSRTHCTYCLIGEMFEPIPEYFERVKNVLR